MPTGIVKWFDAKKGYGFIQPNDGTKDIFVHITEVKKSGLDKLNENQKVEYQISSFQGKMSAIEIKA